MIRKQMHHDALLFQQVDRGFYLRVLRLNRQSDENFINDVVRNNARQILNVTESRNALKAVTVEVCFIVNIADDAIAKIGALSYLVCKPARARSTANNQQRLDVVSVQSQTPQVKAQ